MTIIINAEPHQIPYDPLEITLQQYTDFYDKFGRDIDAEMMAGEDDDTFNIDRLLDKEAAAWFRFWTGYELGDEHAEPYLLQYRILRNVLHTPSGDYPMQLEWQGEVWEIQSPIINAASKANFGEVVTSKEAMNQIKSAGAGRWASLLYLSAIFFRKQGEIYTDELIIPGSDRLALILTLPIQYAISVGFFLNDCVSIWEKTFPYSPQASGKQTPT